MKKVFVFILLSLCFSSAYAEFYNVKKFGATGNKADYATKAVQDAIDAAAKAGGGTVYFPAGEYLCAQINLRDNITLYIDSGAKLWASNKEEDYFEKFYCEDTAGDGIPMMIYGNGVKNVTITGGGIIEGQPEYYTRPSTGNDFRRDDYDAAIEAGVEMIASRWRNRISTIYMYNCIDVRINNITIQNSSAWPCHLRFCERIYLDNIYVFSKLEVAANSDGFDIDGCKDIVISNCIMEVGDDGICFKSTKWHDGYRNCENGLVTNCVIQSSSTAFKIGSESYGDIRNIKFTNCIAKNTNRAITIFCRDGALVENITYSNLDVECRRYGVAWWGSAELVRIMVLKRREASKIGTIRNITLRDIRARVQGSSWIKGFEGMQNIENVLIQNVDIVIEPEHTPDKRAREGITIANAQNIFVDNLKVTWRGEQQQKWSHTLILDNVDDVELKRFRVDHQPKGFEEVYQVKKVTNLTIEK